MSERPVDAWSHAAVELPVWPGGARAAVCLTFDVDAETVHDNRLPYVTPGATALSESRFSIVRGLPRILAMLERLGLPGTFFVPGMTALRHPQAIAAIAQAGHEVGHHGFLHVSPEQCTPWTVRQELEQGLVALEQTVGVRPYGYRAPCWEPTTQVYDLLSELDFRYDSSAMEDDRPYRLLRGDRSLLEFPVHWSLDDYPYFAWKKDAGHLASAETPISVWREEIEQAMQESRLVTLTFHPEVIGRGYRLLALERLLSELLDAGRVWFARHGEVNELIHSGGLSDDRPGADGPADPGSAATSA